VTCVKLPDVTKPVTLYRRIWLVLIVSLLTVSGLNGPAIGMGRPLSPLPGERQALENLKGQAPGEIIFTSKRDGQWGLYRIYADGTHLVRLSPPNVSERRAIFIQNGGKLVFESNRSGLVQSWISNPDLSNAEALSPPGVEEWLQGISSDGRWLLVTRDHTPQGYYLRDSKNSREVKVDFSALNAIKGKTDVWLAPDGRRLFFSYWPEGGGQIGRGVYLAEISPNGKVTPGRKVSDGCGLAWRSDSSELMTVRTVHGGSDIWCVEWDGARRRITSEKNWDYFPAYGPDNQWIAWAAAPMDQHDHKTGNYELYVRPAEGGEPVRLTFHSAPDQDPAWRAQRGPLLTPPSLGRFFEAEAYLHAPGESRKAAGASGGRAAYLPRLHKPAAVVWGQYSHLPAGSYVARFRLRALDGAQGTIELDINGHKKVRQARQLEAADLSTDWQNVELAFELDKPVKDLECRLANLPGGGGVLLDYIEVAPQEPGLPDYLAGLVYEALIAWWWDWIT
jgi:hypothetical protein